MATRGKHLVLFLLLAAVGLYGGVLGAAQSASSRRSEDSLENDLTLYSEVLTLVDRAYVDETDLRPLVAASIEGAADALDPFTVYVPAAEVDGYLADRSSARGRRGLTIVKERGVAYVLAVEDGSPAARAGVESGLVVETIGQLPTRQMPTWKIRRLLWQPPGTRLSLELLEPSGTKRNAQFVLASLEPPPARARWLRGVRVLRIPRFSARTPADVDELLDVGADKSGADKNGEHKLVFDLRGVAGGDAEAAYAVAERFATGELGALVGRDGVLERFQSSRSTSWSGDLVVLVDRGTQGAAEALATVLRQSAGAELVGERTFGHAGTVASIALSSGALLEITAAFYTGDDLEPLAESLEPDLEVPRRSIAAAGAAEPTPYRDEALEQAIDLVVDD